MEARKITSDRQALLEVARKMVADDGYAAFNMAKFAEQAGVSRRTLYNQFSGKQEVLGCLVNFEAEALLEHLRAEVPNSKSFKKYLLNCLLYVINSMQHYHYQELIGVNMVRYYFASDEVNRMWCEHMDARYQAALEAGEIRDDLALSDIMKWFGRIALSYSMFANDEENEAEIKTHVKNFFIHSLEP